MTPDQVSLSSRTQLSVIVGGSRPGDERDRRKSSPERRAGLTSEPEMVAVDLEDDTGEEWQAAAMWWQTLVSGLLGASGAVIAVLFDRRRTERSEARLRVTLDYAGMVAASERLAQEALLIPRWSRSGLGQWGCVGHYPGSHRGGCCRSEPRLGRRL